MNFFSIKKCSIPVDIIILGVDESENKDVSRVKEAILDYLKTFQNVIDKLIKNVSKYIIYFQLFDELL